MKTFKQLCEEINESLKTIQLNGKEVIWNPKKDDKQWKERIKDRTGLSEKEFIEITEKGLNRAFKEDKLCENGTTCLRFFYSRFVIVFNLKKNMIISIRDALWDKVDNGKCKPNWVFEDYKNNIDLKDLIDNFNQDSDGYVFHPVYVEDDVILQVKDKCDCCFEIDL